MDGNSDTHCDGNVDHDSGLDSTCRIHADPDTSVYEHPNLDGHSNGDTDLDGDAD